MMAQRDVRLGQLVCTGCDGTFTVDFEGPYVVCPRCDTKNRAPKESISYPSGRCGYCGRVSEDHPFKDCKRRYW